MSDLAILGGAPIRTKPYPHWPMFDQKDINAVIQTIESGRWGGFPYPGPITSMFVQQFANMQSANYAVAMMNGAITMEVALRAAGIGWGDEVIIPAYTFQATAAATMAAGAIPVFVDIDPDNYCLDPIKTSLAITDKTRAIIVVHIASKLADMDAITEIAVQHSLVVIEDSAHAHGAQWRGSGSGSLGDFGSFSLQSSKIVTTGEGGVLLCKDEKMAERAASIIDCGRPKDPEKQSFTMGINYRMTEIQAALGLIALERLPEQMAERSAMADYLETQLKDLPGIILLPQDPRITKRSLYKYIFKIDPDFWGCNNSIFCKALTQEGIPVDTGYPAMHEYELFQPELSKLPVPSAFPEYFQFEKMSFPVAEKAAKKESVWLGENVFRAGKQGIDDLIAGITKLIEYRDALVDIKI